MDPHFTSRGPWFVVAKNMSSNELFVSNQPDLVAVDEYGEAIDPMERRGQHDRSDSVFTVGKVSWIGAVPEELKRLRTASR
jgi:tRNA U34 2-thiouridine synthase MnmA/TrmU